MHKAESDFRKKLSTQSLAGTAVIFLRSREWERLEHMVRDWSLSETRPFRAWNVLYGWRVLEPSGAYKTEAVRDCLLALKSIVDLDGNGANPLAPRTVCLFEGMKNWLCPAQGQPPQVVLLTLLQTYARLLTDRNSRRVFISVPETFVVPEELEHDIPVIDLDLPDAKELEDVIQQLMLDEGENRAGQPQTYPPEEMRALAQAAAGLTLLECEAAVSTAMIEHRELLPAIPFRTFHASVMNVKAEAVKSSGFLEVMKPVELDDVAGLDIFKEWILERYEDFSEAAGAFGVKRPRGVTFVGPPGCGKTLSAGTVAAVLRRPAVSLEFGSLFGGIVGQTEGNIRRALAAIRALGEVVVFCDEIDRVMGMNTQGGDGGVTKRLIGTLLTFMQNNDTGAFFVFAANRAEGIDSALIRRGRIDQVFGVNVPNRTERLAILKVHLRKGKQNPDKVKGLEQAAACSEGYVGAELESAVQRAISDSFRSGLPITGADIAKHITDIKPLSVSFAEDFAAMAEWAAKNAVPASRPDPEDCKPAVTEGNGALTISRRRWSVGQ